MHELWFYQVGRMGVGREGGVGTHQVCVSSQFKPLIFSRSFTSLTHSFENGIHTFDAADMYSNGESERVLRKALKVRNTPMENVITAKVRLLSQRRAFVTR